MTESKICGYSECGRNFYREPNLSDRSWRQKQYCNRSCGKKAADQRASQKRRKARNRWTTPPPGVLRPVVDQPWRWQAACRDVDGEVFFPDQGPGYQLRVLAAKHVCGPCPVQAECLEWAMGEDFGIAGGLTPDERRHRAAEGLAS